MNLKRDATVCVLFSVLTILLPRLMPAETGPRADEDALVRLLEAPSTDGGNRYYVSNREPLLPSPLIQLPVGSVQPAGWLKRQLELMAEGFPGNLTEISKWCRLAGNAWVTPGGDGQSGWEELPYWLKGLVDLAYLLGDERLLAVARPWVEGVLAGQEPGGYFGPRANWNEKHDLWPNMIMLWALRSFHDATGDARVIPFITRYFRWLATIPLERYLPDSWQKWRGGDLLDSIYWLYNRTGEPWILELARLNHERTADWTGGIPTWHGVNIAQGFREPAQYFQQTRDLRYLRAAERNYETVMASYGRVPGGMFGADENCRPGYEGPRQGAETCSIVELMNSQEMMLRITGNPVWADRCEEIAFNSLPPAMTPDLKGLHYLTAPNQIQLDRGNKAPMIQNEGDMFSYSPWHHRCCQHNVAFGWPYFGKNLWLATAGNGLAAAFYAPGVVTAKVGSGSRVRIEETTDYPFDGIVTLTISLAQPEKFPLLLRIPRWCEGADIRVNGKTVGVKPGPGSWMHLERKWRDRDVVRLGLPMRISVSIWEKNGGVSVYRGPLAFSLKIGERWQKFGESEKWPGWEVFPTTPWNFGLIVDPKNPSRSVAVVRSAGPVPSQPFTPEAAPLQLRVRGQIVSGWKQEANGMIGDWPTDPLVTSAPMRDLILIPMGCARLRISVFPWSLPRGR